MAWRTGLVLIAGFTSTPPLPFHKPAQVSSVQNQISRSVHKRVIGDFSEGVLRAFKGIEANAIFASGRRLGLLLKNNTLPQRAGGRDFGWGCPLGTLQ